MSDPVAASPSQLWSVDLGAAISYPLIADGRVYVTVRSTSSAYGTKLYALDATTGATLWGPIDLGGTYYWSGIAYDAGRVFALNGDGLMRAFDSVSGAMSWSRQLPDQWSFDSAPTARDGYVYTGGAGFGGTLYAVSQSSGAVAWTAPVANGSNSSPAVSAAGVYVSYACGRAYRFAPTTGALMWNRVTGCSGGGGRTTVLAGGDLYVRDSSYGAVLDSGTGAVLRPFAQSGPVPAVDATRRYTLSSSTVQAEALDTGIPIWSFAGDGRLTSAPIVADDRLFVGSSSGKLYAVSTATGAVTWETNVGSGILAPDEHNVSQPLTGLATSGGLLVVPAGSRLVAYR